jgi:hypothetical protein
MLRAFALVCLIAAATGTAHGETLTHDQIEPALNDVTVWYEPMSATSARQFFNHNGETPYVDESGTKTFGRWLVRGDKYCSQWPPSDHYVCYGVERSVDAKGRTIITFLSGGDGKRYTGVAKSGQHVDEAWAE